MNYFSPELKKININGKSTFDFLVFRNGKRHIIGMHDELNSFVSYIKDAAENGEKTYRQTQRTMQGGSPENKTRC